MHHDWHPSLQTLKPAYVSQDGRVSRQHVTHDLGDGRSMHLSYEVEHPEDTFILKIDDEPILVVQLPAKQPSL